MRWTTFYNKAKWLFQQITKKASDPSGDDKLDKLVEKLQEPTYLSEKIEEQEAFDYMKVFKKNIPVEKKLNLRPLFIAASIVSILFIAGIAYYLQLPSSAELISSVGSSVTPISQKALLITHSGEEIHLGDEARKIQIENESNIEADEKGLRYESANQNSSKEIIYNTLVVPRGGEYTLTLSDGTTVWINSDSKLTYPVSFTGDLREVKIEGEAYFSVTHNEQMPFVVKTSLGDITVLGTEFNINSYPNNDGMAATLVTGKIACQLLDGTHKTLKPSQQLIVDQDGRSTLEYVDIRHFTSWKDSLFIFEERSLEELLIQLERWYDVTVVYKNDKAKKLHFSGELNRYENIEVFIDMFQKSSNVEIVLENKELYVDL